MDNPILTVLVVDDEPPVCDMLLSQLQAMEPYQLELMQAHRGEEALNILRLGRVDLIITDIRMPDMTGLALLEKAGNIWPYISGILLTAYPDFAYAQEAIRIHALDYVLKSDPLPAIVQRIRLAIDKVLEELSHQQDDVDVFPTPYRLPPAMLENLLGNPSACADALQAFGFDPENHQLRLLISMGETDGNPLAEPIGRLLRLKIGSSLIQLAYAQIGSRDCLWLAQLADKSAGDSWLVGAVESAQRALQMRHGLPVSFLIGSSATSPVEVAGGYAALISRYRTPFASVSPYVLSISNGDGLLHSSTRNIVQFLQNYIDNHLSEDVSLLKLSIVSGYNADYLARLFKAETGSSIGRYIARSRLRLAEEMLKDPRKSIEEVSLSLGFQSRSYLNRFVKKEIGTTPQAWRRMLLSEG